MAKKTWLALVLLQVLTSAHVTTPTVAIKNLRAAPRPNLLTTEHRNVDLDGSNYTTLAEAVAACPSPGSISVSAPRVWPVTSSVVIPSTCALQVVPGATITVGRGVTLTVNAPIMAGDYPVFSSISGILALGPIPSQKVPELWFPGSDVGARVNAAEASLNRTQEEYEAAPMPTGTIVIDESGVIPLNTMINVYSHKVSVVGQSGRNNLTLTCNLNSDCIRISDAVFGNLYNGPRVGGFKILAGAGTGTRSVGIHAGDMWGLRLFDLTVQGFSGEGQVGIWFDNGRYHSGFIEQGEYRDISLIQNNIGWRYSNSGGRQATTSFGYNNYQHVFFMVDTNQTGVQIDGNTTPNYPPLLYHSNINWTFEPAQAATGAVTYIKMMSNSVLLENEYQIFSEPVYTKPSVTILDMEAGNSIITGHGYWQNWSGGFKIAGANTSVNIDGQVTVNDSVITLLPSNAVTLGTQWGRSAIVTNIVGTWRSFAFTIKAGENTSENAVFHFNFPAVSSGQAGINYTWRNAPNCTVQQISGNSSHGQLTNTGTTKTADTWIWSGTPAAGESYRFIATCIAT